MSLRLGLKKRLGMALSLSTLDPSNSGTGGGVRPPAGYEWLTDFEGNAVYDFESNRMYGAV